jgi:hypothetical protein
MHVSFREIDPAITLTRGADRPGPTRASAGDVEPSIVVCDLFDGQYVESASGVGASTVTTTAPFRLTLAPTSLVG